MIAIIIPCYNEGDRLSIDEFISFLISRKGYNLILVNDGSSDNTLERMNELYSIIPDFVTIVNLEKNAGKAEAVRMGMVKALGNPENKYFGFLDADLSTTLNEFETLADFIQKNNYFESVIGSRMARSGAKIQRKFSRKLFSSVVGILIQSVSKLSINDTQCGAKIFNRELSQLIFKDKFITDWLFDVEIFIRIRKHYGKNFAERKIYEFPLMRWINPEGSKVSLKEIYRTPLMILRINYHYNT